MESIKSLASGFKQQCTTTAQNCFTGIGFSAIGGAVNGLVWRIADNTSPSTILQPFCKVSVGMDAAKRVIANPVEYLLPGFLFTGVQAVWNLCMVPAPKGNVRELCQDLTTAAVFCAMPSVLEGVGAPSSFTSELANEFLSGVAITSSIRVMGHAAIKIIGYAGFVGPLSQVASSAVTAAVGLSHVGYFAGRAADCQTQDAIFTEIVGAVAATGITSVANKYAVDISDRVVKYFHSTKINNNPTEIEFDFDSLFETPNYVTLTMNADGKPTWTTGKFGKQEQEKLPEDFIVLENIEIPETLKTPGYSLFMQTDKAGSFQIFLNTPEQSNLSFDRGLNPFTDAIYSRIVNPFDYFAKSPSFITLSVTNNEAIWQYSNGEDFQPLPQRAIPEIEELTQPWWLDNESHLCIQLDENNEYVFFINKIFTNDEVIYLDAEKNEICRELLAVINPTTSDDEDTSDIDSCDDNDSEGDSNFTDADNKHNPSHNLNNIESNDSQFDPASIPGRSHLNFLD